MRQGVVSEQSRIRFLDGLRGLAVLAVVLWHAYGPTYAEFLPYGDHYSTAFQPVRVLWVGLQLFFMISGFVILMTLNRTKTLVAFAWRRWQRLFPAMAVVSLLILLFNHTVGRGPYIDRTPADLLPGLLFLNPAVIHAVTGTLLRSMDGPFWSLYVEVVFYGVFGVAFFALGVNAAIATLCCCFAGWFVANSMALAGLGGPVLAKAASTLDWIGFVHFGWFASGALFYRFQESGDRRLLALAFGLGLTAVFGVQPKPPYTYGTIDRIGFLVVVALFAAAVTLPRVQALLSARWLLFLGFVSYPLYLFHNNAMIGLTQLLGETGLPIPMVLMPVVPMAVVCVVAWLIARHAEPPIRTLLQGRRVRVAART